MSIIGNVLRGGQSTADNLPLVTIGGSGDVALYEQDNIAVDRWGRPLPLRGSYTTAPIRILKLPAPRIPGVTPMPARQVQDHVVRNAGAFPRDHIDARIVADTIEGRGEIIDDQAQVGGYPNYQETRQAFNEKEWDLRYMTKKEK
jgi:hypothetical protein